MLKIFKNLKRKAKELISTASHDEKVDKTHDISKKSPFPYDIHDKEAAKRYVKENFPPYGESSFSYLENNIIHDFKNACDSLFGPKAYSYSCVDLD